MYEGMYSFDGRVRYSETDSEGKLTLASLIDYFQDCSTFQSEDLGLGFGYLKAYNMVWVLSSWQIVVDRYPGFCERIQVGTAPYEFKSFLGFRNFAMTTTGGECLARANSIWSLLNTGTGKPVAPTEDMKAGYSLREKLPMDYAPRKIELPEGGRHEEPIVVKKHHLDTNHHVNNGQYVSMAMEYLPEGFAIRQLRAEYKKQAFLEDELFPYVAHRKNICTVALMDGTDKPYAVMEFAEEAHQD